MSARERLVRVVTEALAGKHFVVHRLGGGAKYGENVNVSAKAADQLAKAVVAAMEAEMGLRVESESEPIICTCDGVKVQKYGHQVVMVHPHAIKKPLVGVDVCVASAVAEVWHRGIGTDGSCCGHGLGDAWINADPSDAARLAALGWAQSSENSHTFTRATTHKPTSAPAPPKSLGPLALALIQQVKEATHV